jgi:hypothetical protein
LCMPASSPVNKPALPVLSGKSATVLPFVPADYSHRKAVNRKALRDSLDITMTEKAIMISAKPVSPIWINEPQEIIKQDKAWLIRKVHGTYKTCSSKANQDLIDQPMPIQPTVPRCVLFNEIKYRRTSQRIRTELDENSQVKLANFIRSFFDSSKKLIKPEALDKSEIKLASRRFQIEEPVQMVEKRVKDVKKQQLRPSAARSLLLSKVNTRRNQDTNQSVDTSKSIVDRHLISSEANDFLDKSVTPRKDRSNILYGGSPQKGRLSKRASIILQSRRMVEAPPVTVISRQGMNLITLRPNPRYISYNSRLY